MSITIEAYRGATGYNLHDGNPYWVMSLTGAGLPPTRLIKERGPQQHGSTVVGFLLDERLLNLALLIDAANEAEADDDRDTLAEILKPIDGVPINLRLTRANASVRQLDAYMVNMVDFPITNEARMAGKQMVVAQLEAPDPIPYDPTLQNIVFTVASGSGAPGGFAVPTMIPMLSTVGDSIDDVETLTYSGKWEVFPRLYITGPADDVVITNETTGKVLDFTGHTIAGGDTYEIDLRYGYKRILDQNGNRKNAALTDESDLVTWSIVPAPTASGGVNDIRVYIPAGADVATQVSVSFYNRYPNFG